MNKVEISGVNTAKLPLLTPEEKVELMQKIKQGDEEARQKFINGNLRLLDVLGGEAKMQMIYFK